MKTRILILSVALMLGGLNIASAQKVVLDNGDIAPIKGEKQINIEYDYSSFGVGKFKTEEEYVNEKVEEHNKKEPGKGDKWKEGWINARTTAYHPKFEELLNKSASKKDMNFSNYPDAKYTLKVKTNFIEPGFNVGVMKKPASANLQYIFYESANPENIVASYRQERIPGSQFGGYDFDATTRIAESYAKGGKSLGALLAK